MFNLKMDQNEKKFVKAVVDLESNILKAKKYLKESYNIDTEFDTEEFTVNISGKINESQNSDLNILKAKQYLNEQFDGILSVNII